MKRKIAGIIAALAMAMGFGVFATPDVAFASTVFGCPEDNFCLYNWIYTNVNGGIYRIPLSDLYQGSGPCLNLTGKYYAEHNTNITVYDTPSSLIVNTLGGLNTNRIHFFEWINCNYAGRQAWVNSSGYSRIDNLNTWGDFGDTIASVQYEWYP